MGFVHDLTEWKQTELALGKSEDQSLGRVKITPPADVSSAIEYMPPYHEYTGLSVWTILRPNSIVVERGTLF